MGNSGKWGYAVLFALSALQPVQTLFAIESDRFPGLDDPVQYTTTDGLSQSSVYAVVQDEQGFIWIGTQDGLNRFDGYLFKKYHFGDESRDAFWVTALYADQRGRVWVGTRSQGLGYYDKATGRYTSVSLGSQSKAAIAVNDIQGDVDGRVWVALDSGLVRVDPRTPNQQTRFESGKVGRLYRSRTRGLWAVMGNYVIVWNDHAARFDRVATFPETVVDLVMTVGGTVLVATTRHVYAVKLPGGMQSARVLEVALDAEHRFTFIRQLPDDRFVIGTNGDGVRFLNGANFSLQTIRYNAFRPTGFGSFGYWTALLDHDNNLWFGSRGGGLWKLDRLRARFQSVQNPGGDPNGLADNIVLSVAEDQHGHTWVGTTRGLSRIDLATGALHTYRRLNFGAAENHRVIRDFAVRALAPWRQDRVWLSIVGTGLLLHDHHSGQSRSASEVFGPSAAILDSETVRAVLATRSGLWIGTDRAGIYRCDAKRPDVQHFSAPASAAGRPIAVRTLAEDASQRLWVGSDGQGLYLLKPGSSAMQFVPGTESTTINDILADSRGGIWAGSTIGLMHLDSTGKLLERVGRKNGLPNTYIYSVLEAPDGHLWVSSNAGLSRYNPDNTAVWNFDHRDGLKNNEFNADAGAVGVSGRLYFGGVAGLTIIPQTELRRSQAQVRVVFTDVLSPGPSALDSMDISTRKSIQIASTQRVFGIRFVGMGASISKKNTYRYRLLPIDREWHYLGGQHELIFSYLAPGDYQLEVSASNSDGVRSDNVSRIELRLAPRYWQTWWFKAILGVIILAVLAAVLRVRKRMVRVQQQVRSNIASDLHDEMGAALSNVLVQAQLLEQGTDTQNAIQRLVELARRLLCQLDEIVWAIEFRNDTLAALLDRINECARDVPENQSIAIKTNLGGKDANTHLGGAFRQDVFRIVNEAVTNCAKHSKGDRVEIRIDCSGKRLRVEIRDNGCDAIDPESSTGNGLRNMRRRAARLNATLGFSFMDGNVVELNTPWAS